MNILIFITTAIVVACSVLSSVVKANTTELSDRTWVDRLEYKGIAVIEPGYHVWGSSPIVGANGNVHLFVARWPVSATFRGWYTRSEIARYESDKPEGPFSFKEVVLQGTKSATWDKVAPHNPSIQKVGDNYVLLYIARSEENSPASQQIGMLISKKLDGPWVKVNENGLILSPPKDPSVWSHKTKLGVNNPALLQHPDGRFFMYYKAKLAGDVRRMSVAIADNIEGPYVFHKTPLTSNTSEIEDGYAFVENGKIRLLTTHNHKGTGLLWESDDGIAFDTPILGFEKMDHYISKKELKEATNYRGKKFERPQLLIQDGHPTYLYVASGANLLKGDGSGSYVLKINGVSSEVSK